jgi:glycosyltransferase involved in cell wall biosynthesis
MTFKSKLKILMCSEASFIKSGFGTYAKEILSRLHKTNKYIIAEFASYGFVNDPRDKEIDWIYYANAVKDGDPRHKEYQSRTDNQFGRWRFEKVLLDFKPDIVIDVRDYWMSSYQLYSPLREYFHWILMPTVDSFPQQEEWIDTFLNADAVFTYSDWGARVLASQSSGKINYIDTTSPGVDLTTFNIQDKAQARQTMGISDDYFIVGSVMRNQKRKLIPELCVVLRSTIDMLKENNDILGEKLRLYLHTSYPDAGWDLPELLKDYGLMNRVLFTYFCRTCSQPHASVFQGPNKICPKCLNQSCSLPSVTNGLSSQQLATVYNTFDIYSQYAICEGFGMPQVEAGACGIPVATVEYSAMIDIIDKLEAFTIRVGTVFKELETKALRVYPNNSDLSNIITEFAKLSKSDQDKKRSSTRELTEKYYSWDNIAKKWEQYLDKLNETYRATWDEPSNILKNIANKEQLEQNKEKNFDYALTFCANNLNDMDAIGSYRILDLLKSADYGFSQNGPSIQNTDIKQLVDHIDMFVTNKNKAEEVRSSHMEFDDDFIKYAKIKAMKQ